MTKKIANQAAKELKGYLDKTWKISVCPDIMDKGYFTKATCGPIYLSVEEKDNKFVYWVLINDDPDVTCGGLSMWTPDKVECYSTPLEAVQAAFFPVRNVVNRLNQVVYVCQRALFGLERMSL